MNPITLVGILVIIVGLSVQVLTKQDESPKWVIVANPQTGRFSFTDWLGRVVKEDFETREAAVGAMEKLKAWSAEYDATHEAEEELARAKQALREKQFQREKR